MRPINFKPQTFGVLLLPPLLLALAACQTSPLLDDDPASSVDHESTAQTETRLELRAAPLPDLYFGIRALAASKAPVTHAYQGAVQAAQALHATFGSFGSIGAVDSYTFIASTPSEFTSYVSELPDPMQNFGREVSARDDAVQLGKAMEQLWDEFQANGWSEHNKEISSVIARLDSDFFGKHQEALGYMLESLGINDPDITVPLYLVTHANPPGAMAYYLRDGPAVILDIQQSGTDALLQEIILHETCHTLDQASNDPDNAFATFRSLLEERGISQRDRRYRSIPHLLMFVQAEETMRRIYNPQHQAYGDAKGVYERSNAVAPVLRKHWRAFLDGNTTRAEALQRIVSELDPEPTKTD